MSLSPKILTPKEAEKLYDWCYNELEKNLGLDGGIEKCMLVAPRRTKEEYIYALRLIHSAKYYLKFFKRGKDDLYLLYSKDLDLYKIGITKNIDVRMKSIKKEMNLEHLELIYLIPEMAHLEKILHQKYKDKNVLVQRKQNHREWFKFDEEIIKEYKQLSYE